MYSERLTMDKFWELTENFDIFGAFFCTLRVRQASVAMSVPYFAAHVDSVLELS